LFVRSDEYKYHSTEDVSRVNMKDIEQDLFSTNKDLMIYVLHGCKVYFWKKGMANTVEEVITTQSREFTLIRKDEFVIRADNEVKDKEPVFSMKRISMKYSSHQITSIYDEK